MARARFLVRGSELTGWPVVTFAGEREAEIKDVLFDRDEGRLNGFTLRNPGLFSRSRGDALPWSGVHGLGRDAVIIRGADVLVPAGELIANWEVKQGDVLKDQVLTDSGVELGEVVDVVLQVGDNTEAVGYEIKAGDALPSAGKKVFIPAPVTLAVSGEKLIVPAAAAEFVANDLTGFGAAVDAFRGRLSERQP